MSTYVVEGFQTLEGEVKPSGNKDSAVKIIIASLLSSQDVVIENVPRTSDIEIIVKVILEMGGSANWIGDNKICVNGSTVNTHIVPQEMGSATRFSTLLAGPLLYKFGRAKFPKVHKSTFSFNPINRWMDTWAQLGAEMTDLGDSILLEAKEIRSANINFKINTHTGTANALLSSIFAAGETIITNAAEETEVDDLIDFLNIIGGEVERIEPRKIRIIGKNVFNGGYFEVQPDNIETIAYATAAVITRGNINIKGLKKLQLTSFVNFLTKVGVRYEYNRNELNVWYGGEEFSPVKVESAPAPGFLADWLPYAILILNNAKGESIVHDTIYVDRLCFVQDLNRMGANIELKKPTDVGLQPFISDESYDFTNLGYPNTVAVIKGPQKLRGTRFNMDDSRFDSVLTIAALSAEGKSELIGVDEMFIRYERFFEKLGNLGARIHQ